MNIIYVDEINSHRLNTFGEVADSVSRPCRQPEENGVPFDRPTKLVSRQLNASSLSEAAINYKKIESDYMFIRSSHSAKDAGLCPRPERLRQLKALQKKKIIPFKGKITHHYDDPKWTFGYLEEYLSYKMAYLRAHEPQSGVSQC